MATRDTYKTNNGKYLFEFIFEKKGSYFDVHIARQPSYGYRENDLHNTHRLSSNYGGCSHRICFANASDANTESKARSFAESWSEATGKYIDTGRGF